MRLDRRRLRVLLIAAAGVVAATLALILSGTGALDGAESLTVDERFQIRGTRDVPDDVVVVAIDDESIREIGILPPFPRSLHAAAIANLTRAGARALAYDIQFSEATSKEEDEALETAIRESKRVVLGTGEVRAIGEPLVLARFADAAGGAVGVANFPDPSFGRVPHTVDGVASLAVAAVAKSSGSPVPSGGFDGDGARIDYHGRLGTIPQLLFADAISGNFDPEEVNDKIVVVGYTSNSLGDVHPTPMGGFPMSGPEINANAISTVLRGLPLRDAAAWLNVAILLGLTALATLAALRRSALVGLLVAAGLIVANLVLAQLAFDNGRVVDVAAPVLSVALVGIAGLAINYWLVVRDRTRLRTEFARFLPAPIVDDVVDQAGVSGRLGGRRMYATVMFADLRGFTAAAEKLPPEVVIDVLNRYLAEMGDAVLDHGGTLVAYQGDGLMAVFGAPVEQADHADRAMAAAREMRDRRLPAFNTWAATQGIAEGFRMGIGLASGPVMSGNVGSERRLEYTAVGDTTNAAARLEALTKETPHMLLISDATRAALTKPVPDLTAVGALDVRGREVPASVWTLPEIAEGLDDASPSGRSGEDGSG